MLKMSQINHIRDLSKCGYNVSEIHRKTGADHKTIEKYLAKDLLNEKFENLSSIRTNRLFMSG